MKINQLVQKISYAAVTLALICQSAVAATNCQSTITPISEIQGNQAQSPLQGKTVSTRGVVLAVLYGDSKKPQLLLASQKPDGDTRTAESVLLSDTDLAKRVQPGDVLRLTGTVRELGAMTALTNLTEIVPCGQASLPKATAVTLPVADLAQWEAYEGMLLSFPQTLVVNDSYGLSRYGELMLGSQRLMVPTEVTTPGVKAATLAQTQLLDQLVIDDGSLQQNPAQIRFPTGNLSASNTVRVGDSIQALTGYLVQAKSGYRLIVANQPTFIASNPRQSAPPAKAKGQLRVASFNVLNFFTGDGSAHAFPTKRGASTPEELARQQAKMIAAISAMQADVIGLLEVQNNGFAEGSAIATIVDALNQAVGSDAYAMVVPKQKPGTDEIMVAMIYRKAAVQPVGAAAVLLEEPFNRGSRPPLAQSFVEQTSKTPFTVSINHFKSKGSCPRQTNAESDKGDGQGCWTPSRVKAANAVSSWLRSNPTGVATELRLMMGDLNAYRMEEPLQALAAQGWQHLADEKQVHSSFVYQGRSGTLDHALASPALKAKMTRFAHWPINADEPAALDYNMEFKSKAQQDNLYAPTPFRSSDHDPLYVDFKF